LTKWVSWIVIGGGFLGGVSFLKWLVSRGKFRWLEKKCNG
jgi:hypothetical protein